MPPKLTQSGLLLNVKVQTYRKAFTCICTCISFPVSLRYVDADSRQTLDHVRFMCRCWRVSWEDKLKQGSVISLHIAVVVFAAWALPRQEHCFHICSTLGETQTLLFTLNSHHHFNSLAVFSLLARKVFLCSCHCLNYFCTLSCGKGQLICLWWQWNVSGAGFTVE